MHLTAKQNLKKKVLEPFNEFERNIWKRNHFANEVFNPWFGFSLRCQWSGLLIARAKQNIIISNTIIGVGTMKKAYTRLTFEDRIKIERMKKQNYSIRAIAKELGVSSGAIHYELKKGTAFGSGNYDAEYAEAQSKRNASAKARKAILSLNPQLAERIAELILRDGQSPEQIHSTLQAEGPADMIISINTIYRAIDHNLIPGVTRANLRSNETKMFSNGLVCVPKWAREELQLCDGDVFLVEILDGKVILLKKRTAMDMPDNGTES